MVLFSDLHLDSGFAWAGAEGPLARKRREALRETLRNIVELTRQVGAQALLCAGDLYENERRTPDTENFLRSTFEQLDPIRVFLAPGNHDWYGPGSLYRKVDWSENVHVFDSSRLVPVELEAGLTLWGAAHCAPAGTEGFLRDFQVDRGGINLALFHGSETSWLTEQGDGKSPHAPFEPDEIERARLQHAFVGHYHRPRDAAFHTYPGNADPLSFGEDGDRGAVVVTVSPDGSITRERHKVAVTKVHDLYVDVSGCSNRQEVRDCIVGATAGLAGIARVTLTGELAVEVDMKHADLKDAAPSLDCIEIRAGDLRVAYDLEKIATEPTVQGQFVRIVRGAELKPAERRRVLLTGLRALDNRDDLEVL